MLNSIEIEMKKTLYSFEWMNTAFFLLNYGFAVAVVTAF